MNINTGIKWHAEKLVKLKPKITLAWIILLLCLTKSNAQITSASDKFTTKNDNGEDPEYVTVESIMPYKITPFNWRSLTAFMDPSIFKWWLNGDATGYSLLKSDGITPLTLLPPPNHVYYPDSMISIQWIKTGKYTIRVHEKNMPKLGINGCDNPGDFQTLDVVVADRPTASWDGLTTKGGCNLDNTTQIVPLILKGSKQITITYDLVYSPQTGTPVTTSNQTAVFNSANNDESITVHIQIDIPKGKYGKYEVFIKGITDKISTKCGIASQNSDYPSDRYTIAVLPVLETGPIEFVTEL